MRFRFIAEHRRAYPVRVMCRVLKVSPSGYYAWRSRSRSRRSREDRRLKVLIRAIHRQSRKSYGAPRIHVELVEQGETQAKHRQDRRQFMDAAHAPGNPRPAALHEIRFAKDRRHF